MDATGRWAAQRHLPRVEGHRAGIDSVRDIVETSARLGIDVLTLYAFSIENWKRPRAEVSTLMMLLKRYLRSELNTLLDNNIRFRVIGRQDELSPDVQTELEMGIERTSKNTGMLFNIALNYGGRAEIVDAARRAIASGVDPAGLDERRVWLRSGFCVPDRGGNLVSVGFGEEHAPRRGACRAGARGRGCRLRHDEPRVFRADVRRVDGHRARRRADFGDDRGWFDDAA